VNELGQFLQEGALVFALHISFDFTFFVTLVEASRVRVGHSLVGQKPLLQTL
jgi:hypothetical protein